MDYEEKILERQESITDDCKICFNKNDCKNQCTEIEEHYNPMLNK